MQKGNRKAQKTFYNQFAPRMMGVCIRYSPDRDSANDLMQEGFIKVFYNLKEFKGTGSLEGWMRKIFINCALEKSGSQSVGENYVPSSHFCFPHCCRNCIASFIRRMFIPISFCFLLSNSSKKGGRSK